MYKEFLEAVLAYVTALNQTSNSLDEKDGLTPYVTMVPVILEDQLCGFISDEIGGAYSYHEASDEARNWWSIRPKSLYG